MRAFAVRRGDSERQLIGKVLCHDIRGLFRKGHVLRGEDIPPLIAASWNELHVLEMGADDVGQRDAGERLAASLLSDGLQSAPSGHRHVLKAKQNSLLKIDIDSLERLNSVPGVAVFTLPHDRVVAAGEVVCEAQITPLAIEGALLEEAEEIARSTTIVRTLPFATREVSFWMRDDRMLRAVTEKLRWFGCSMRSVMDLPRDAAAIAESMRGADGTLFLVSGSNALDPFDPVFEALEQIGATMQRRGLPVHPGTLLWIATWKDKTIIGLPSCGLGPQVTAFDLVLPKLLAEGSISEADIARLGHGGILAGSPSPRLRREGG
jgi:hypothetical protein